MYQQVSSKPESQVSREQILSNTEVLIATHNAYLELDQQVSTLSQQVVEAIGFDAYCNLDRPKNMIGLTLETISKGLSIFKDSKTKTNDDLINEYSHLKKKRAEFINNHFRSDNNLFAVLGRLRASVTEFAEPDPEMTDTLRYIDPGVRDLKNGDIFSIIDDNEDVMRITNPLALGDKYAKEFLNSPVANIFREGWAIVQKEGEQWVRRAILDIAIDKETKQFVFALDPNLYNSRADAVQWAITADEGNSPDLNDNEVGLAGNRPQAIVQAVVAGGRKSPQMSIDPAIHYPMFHTIDEEMMSKAYIVVSRPPQIEPLQPAAQ